MDKTKLKKIIAREGLILFVPIAGIIFLALSKRNMDAHYSILGMTNDLVSARPSLESSWKFSTIGWWLLRGYAVYLPLRFILWASKTLRSK